MSEQPDDGDIHNPADVEKKIVETKNRIAAGVKIVSAAERKMKAKKRDLDLAQAYAMKKAEGPEYLRKAEVTIATMAYREEAENEDHLSGSSAARQVARRSPASNRC